VDLIETKACFKIQISGCKARSNSFGRRGGTSERDFSRGEKGGAGRLPRVFNDPHPAFGTPGGPGGVEVTRPTQGGNGEGWKRTAGAARNGLELRKVKEESRGSGAGLLGGGSVRGSEEKTEIPSRHVDPAGKEASPYQMGGHVLFVIAFQWKKEKKVKQPIRDDAKKKIGLVVWGGGCLQVRRNRDGGKKKKKRNVLGTGRY